MVAISGYYLGVTPPNSSSYYSQRTQSMSQASLGSATSAHKTAPNRSSMPGPARTPNGTLQASQKPTVEPTPEVPEAEVEVVNGLRPKGHAGGGHRSNGTMDRNFKFPPALPPSPPPPVPSPPVEPKPSDKSSADDLSPDISERLSSVDIITPANIEVPPPPPVEKERRTIVEDTDEEVGETVEIDLR